MLGWFRRTMGESGTTIGGAFGVLDEVFNPGAARARELLEEQKELAVAKPSPGDKLYDEGRIVITRRKSADGGPSQPPDADNRMPPTHR